MNNKIWILLTSSFMTLFISSMALGFTPDNSSFHKTNKRKTSSITLIENQKAPMKKKRPPRSSFEVEPTTLDNPTLNEFGAKYSGASMGLFGSILTTNMDVTLSWLEQNTEKSASANMSGTNYGITGYYDYPFSRDFQLRYMLGVETFNVSKVISTPSCDSRTSENCYVNINYFSLFGLAKYNLILKRTLRIWAGLGAGYLIPISKSSSIIKTSDLKSNFLYVAALGGDYVFSPTKFIPFSLEYGIFPASNEVKATNIYIRCGYGWSL